MLITGATSGIGFAYAKELARQKKSLILVARNEVVLKEVSAELETEFTIKTCVIAADF